jgi:hypothetical protein
MVAIRIIEKPSSAHNLAKVLFHMMDVGLLMYSFRLNIYNGRKIRSLL